MLIDRKLQFIDGAVDAITKTSDVVEFYSDGDFKLSANRHGAGYWNVHVNKDITGTGTIKLQDSANGSSYADVAGMAVTLTNLKAGAKASLRIPAGTRKFLKVVVDSGVTEGRVTSYLGDPIAEH